MASISRRAKAINAGSHKAGAPEAGCSGNRDLVADANPARLDGEENPKSHLPGWILKRAAEPSKAVAHPNAESFHGFEEFMTVAEAASVLRISERTVRRHLGEGKIPHIRAGKQIRIPRAGLLRGWQKNKLNQ